jgi:hypothetical protein
MSHTARLLVAVPMGLLFFAAGVVVFYIGMMVGVMGTDSCRSVNFGGWTIWLFGVWPLILLASALAPSILVLRGAGLWWVLGSILAGIAASAAGYAVWFLIVIKLCK